MWATDEIFDSDATVETLWPLYTSAKAWPRWSDDMHWSHSGGRLEAGVQVRVEFRGLPASSYTVTGVDPPHSFTIHMRMLLTTVQFDHRLTARDQGTRIEERIDFRGLLAPLLGLIERSRIR